MACVCVDVGVLWSVLVCVVVGVVVLCWFVLCGVVLCCEFVEVRGGVVVFIVV